MDTLQADVAVLKERVTRLEKLTETVERVEKTLNAMLSEMEGRRKFLTNLKVIIASAATFITVFSAVIPVFAYKYGYTYGYNKPSPEQERQLRHYSRQFTKLAGDQEK